MVNSTGVYYEQGIRMGKKKVMDYSGNLDTIIE